jgi:hypothetical protein
VPANAPQSPQATDIAGNMSNTPDPQKEIAVDREPLRAPGAIDLAR